MRLYFAFVSSFFFASTVLAHRLREHRQSQLLKRDAPYYNPTWAGAVLVESDGTFTSVAGDFTVTTPSGQDGDGASVWVGIDGYPCATSGLLQTGIDMYFTNNGPTYSAWAQFYPEDAYYFPNFPISPGDTIAVNVTAFSSTSGIAFVENLTTGQSVSEQLSSSHAICGQTAEWIVEDFRSGSGNQILLANFGTVVFTNAATVGSGTYTPDEATIFEIQQNNQILSSVSTDSSSVTIAHV